MKNSIFRSVSIASFGSTVAQRDPRAGVAVSLPVQIDDKYFTAGAAIISNAGADGESGLCSTLHNHDLLCTDDFYQVFFGSAKTLAKFQGLLYSYPFKSDEEVLETLSELYSSADYVYPMRAMQVVGSANNTSAFSSPGAHNSDVGAGGMEKKDIVKARFHPVDLYGKRVS